MEMKGVLVIFYHDENATPCMLRFFIQLSG
jgi:hypothetical protein